MQIISQNKCINNQIEVNGVRKCYLLAFPQDRRRVTVEDSRRLTFDYSHVPNHRFALGKYFAYDFPCTKWLEVFQQLKHADLRLVKAYDFYVVFADDLLNLLGKYTPDNYLVLHIGLLRKYNYLLHNFGNTGSSSLLRTDEATYRALIEATSSLRDPDSLAVQQRLDFDIDPP